jgi:hypothetical protein
MVLKPAVLCTVRANAHTQCESNRYIAIQTFMEEEAASGGRKTKIERAKD